MNWILWTITALILALPLALLWAWRWDMTTTAAVSGTELFLAHRIAMTVSRIQEKARDFTLRVRFGLRMN